MINNKKSLQIGIKIQPLILSGGSGTRLWPLSRNKLPKQLNTKIGEKGGILSGGQLQRIGIARSLYFNKKVIILVEPTSSLDNKSSNKIIKMLNKLKKNKIIILVTHSSSVAKASDKVYNIDKGVLN